MLDFIFRYVWLIIPASGYIVWSFYSIKDIKLYIDDDFELEESTVLWIITTSFAISVILLIVCCISFSYWLWSMG